MYINGGSAPFIGYFFDIGQKVSFTETTAEVFSYTEQKKTVYKLDQFFPHAMAPRYAFSPQKRLKWLFQHGWVPRVSGEKIAFITHTFSTNDLVRACDGIRRDLSRENPKDIQIGELRKNSEITELLITLIDEFRGNLIEEKFDVALHCLQEAHIQSKKALIIRRLLADYLFFRKKVEACDLYLELHKLNPDEVNLLEKAILSDPRKDVFLSKIKNGGFSQEVKLSLCVTGFLASDGQLDCYFNKEKTGVEFDPIMLVVQRQMTPAKDKKRQFTKLLSKTENEEASPAASPTPSPRSGTALHRAKTVFKTVTKRPSSIKAKESQRGSLVISPPTESGAQKNQRGEYLFAIELLIQQKKYEEAVQKIENAIADCQLPTPFYERLITILPKCSSKYSEEDCLRKLQYDETLAREKIEYVAAILYERNKSFELGIELADHYIANGKIDQAYRLLFSVAKANASSPDKVAGCLEKLGGLGKTASSCLSDDEIKILYLLGLGVGKTYLNLFAKREPPALPLAAHSGDSSYFCFDHPLYVACWTSFDKRILFTKERAEVYHFDEGRTETLPLIFPQEVPDSERFFTADSIRWLLGKGYRPDLTPEGVVFSNLPDESGYKLVLAKAHKNQELNQFIAYFKEKNYGLAHAELVKIENQESIRELYAEFYAFLKRPEAVSRFRDLSRGSEEALYYVQRALMCATAVKARDTYSIYKQLLDLLQNSHFSDYQASWLSLHAFLYFRLRDLNKDYADAFIDTVPAPFGSLARIGCLDRPKEMVITNQEIETRYKAIRQALIEMCRRTDLERFFQQDAFQEKLDAMNLLILQIKNISRTEVDLAQVASHLEQLAVDVAGGEYTAAIKTLFAARDSFLPAETIERKNGYLKLENDPELGIYYRAKNECDDEKERAHLEQIFDAMTKKGPRINLKGIFISDAFSQAVKAVEAAIPKNYLDELRQALATMKKYVYEGNYPEAEKQLHHIEQMKLPDSIKDKINEMHRVYVEYAPVAPVEELLCRPSFSQVVLSVQLLKQKCDAIKEAPEALMRFINHLDAENYNKAELALVQAREVSNEEVRKRIKDLYFHFMFVFNRNKRAIEVGFELLQEKEQTGERSRNSAQIGRQRVGLRNGLWPGEQSDLLYYLEHLLALCVELNHPRLAEVYDKIFEIFHAKKAPKKIVSLVALHALFHLIDQNLEAAKRFYGKVDIEDPLLFPFARLALLDRKLKTVRQEQYGLLVRFLEDQDKISAYFGENPICSLESEVFAHCLKIFQSERMYQEKKLALVFVDTLQECGFLKSALDMVGLVTARLNRFNLGSARYSYFLEERLQAGRFSCLKREAALSLLDGRIGHAAAALQSLQRLYEKNRKEEKSMLCTKLLYTHTKLQSAYRTLVKTLPPKEADRLSLDNAFRSLLASGWSDVQESLKSIVDRNHLTGDERVIVELIEAYIVEKKIAALSLDNA